MNEASSGRALCQELCVSRQTPPPIPPPVVFHTPPPLPPPIMATSVGENFAALSAVPPHLNGRALEPMEAYRPPREMLPEPHGTARLPRAAFAASMLLVLGLGLWTRWLIDDSTARLEQATLAMQSPIEIYQPVVSDESRLTESGIAALALPSSDLIDDDTTLVAATISSVESSPRVVSTIENARQDQSPTATPTNVEVVHDAGKAAHTPADTTVQFVSAAMPAGANATTPTVANDVPLPMLPVCDAEVCKPQRKLDTALVWAESINEAAALANEQGKLVFLIHVSGNFEIEEFT
jgi:hypothetical protein